LTRAGREKPRVLVLVTLAEVGGAQTYVARLLPALAERYDVTVAAHGPGPLAAAAEDAGARFVPLANVRRPISARDVLGLIELVQLIRRIQPDLVHINSSKAGVLGRLAARIARVPVVVFTVHGWAFKAADGAARTAYLWADRACRRLTTCTICVSQTELEAGLDARTCTSARSVVIRNGVAAHATPRATLEGNPPVVLSVGRLKAPKTFVTLVEALARLDPGTFRAQIVGEGPERAAVEAALRGPVELLGEREDVPALLAAADVFVLSSASEGLPMSVLEAMAAGLPVVASAVGGVPELVADTGVLVPPRDPGALAEALRTVIADRELRVRLASAARERVQAEFSLERSVAAHLELYEELLNTTP
jgi:glycosyltransferase involved in cell wall biosynthesis